MSVLADFISCGQTLASSRIVIVPSLVFLAMLPVLAGGPRFTTDRHAVSAIFGSRPWQSLDFFQPQKKKTWRGKSQKMQRTVLSVGALAGQACSLGNEAELTHFAGNGFELGCKNEPKED